MSRFYDFTLNDIQGNPVNFDRYRNKVCIVYNTASE